MASISGVKCGICAHLQGAKRVQMTVPIILKALSVTPTFGDKAHSSFFLDLVRSLVAVTIS